MAKTCSGVKSVSPTLRSTDHFLWNTSEILGTGATSTIYKGRFKKNGDVVAVKCFNPISQLRPAKVQMREFEIMWKLKHRNVIKLIAIEEEHGNTQNVIIMELCAHGSLYTVLDEPENAFGVAEEEYIVVLTDIAEGMNYLKASGIIHRDIKPGNIMKTVGEKGKPVYKLADFGAARELGEKENFVSLHGTEEYLHPDLYEPAVLKIPRNKHFNGRVDLWSLGVTLAHLATGELPFRPYGGRKNKQILFEMTSKKENGVISGIQKEENGEIFWSKDLPKTNRFSMGFRALITMILAGLMEIDPSRMWSFEKFYCSVQDIKKMKIFHVFSVSTAKLCRIYLKPEQSFAHFQEEAAKQTNIRAGKQCFLLGCDIFEPDCELMALKFPRTSPENPIFMFPKGINTLPISPFPFTPKYEKAEPKYSLNNDATYSKKCAAIAHFIHKTMKDNFHCEYLMVKARNYFRYNMMQKQIGGLRQAVFNIKSLLTECSFSFDSCSKSLAVAKKAFEIVKGRNENSSNEDYFDKEFDKNTSNCKNTLIKSNKKLENTVEELESLEKKVLKCEENNRVETFFACSEDDQCCLSSHSALLKAINDIAVRFKKDKKIGSLGYNHEQIHKFDKQNLIDACDRSVSIIQGHCEPNWINCCKEFFNWLGITSGYQESIYKLDKELLTLQEDSFFLKNRMHEVENNYIKIELSNSLEKLLVVNFSYQASDNNNCFKCDQCSCCREETVKSQNLKKLRKVKLKKENKPTVDILKETEETISSFNNILPSITEPM